METIVASLGEGLVLCDRELRFRAWNPFMERLTGMPASEVIGHTVLEVFPHVTEDVPVALLRRALEGESGESEDTPFSVPTTGRSGWIVARFDPYRNADGEIVGAVGLIRDVSDRKRAERALAASRRELEIHTRIAEVFLTVEDEEIYERVLEVVLQAFDSPHGVFGFIDDEGNLVCPSMTPGISEQCRMDDTTIVFPQSAWAGIWGEALSTKRSVLSNEPGHVPEGHIAIRRCVFVPIVERAERIGLLAVANRDTDYTEEDRVQLEAIAGHIGPILHARLARDREENERLRIERALRASRMRYRAVVDQQTELVERFTEDGTITFVNDAVCRFFDVDRRSLIGTKFHPLMSDGDREATQRHLASLGPDNPVGVIEVECVARDGSKRWLSWASQALVDDDGNFVEFQSAGRDVTEQKQAEDDLRRALADKNELLKEVHHRVKNNMAVISSMISLQSVDVVSDETVHSLNKIRDRIRAMALIHDQMYRSEDYRNVDLGEYARRLTDSLLQAHADRAGSIVLQTRICDVAVNIDVAIPCAMILNELVTNSLEHGFQAGTRGEIVVTLDRLEDSRLELAVADNGVGFNEDSVFRGQKRMGLELVALLAKQLGGELETRWENGADVRVRFAFEEVGTDPARPSVLT